MEHHRPLHPFLGRVPHLERTWRGMHRPGVTELLAAALAVAVVLGWSDAPLVEDSLFWWVPKGLLVAESGPDLVLAHTLPEVISEGLSVDATPPQWASGLPDYAHPPLWYWWLGAWIRALGPSVEAIHLACAPVAAAAAAAWVALARRLGAPIAGLAPLAVPPVVAQFVRPELDLPLLATVSWSLVALLGGRWGWFAAVSALAVWCKEPGVLLVVPATLRILSTREWRALPLAWSPLGALGIWGLLHGGLASAERLPDSWHAWLMDDLPAAVRLVCWEQGRGLLLFGLVGAGLALRHRHRSPWRWLGGLVVCWCLFFSVVGFRLQPQNPDPLTHVRYFGPGVAILAVLSAVRWPWVSLPGLLFLHAASPYGPEASFYGVDAGRAEAASAGWIQDRVKEGRSVWVGSYQVAALSQSWAGHGTGGAAGVRMYSAQTDPRSLALGDIVVFAAYGEPAGPILRTWTVDGLQEWTAGEASVVAAEIIGTREPSHR